MGYVRRDYAVKTERCPRCNIVFILNPSSVNYHKTNCKVRSKYTPKNNRGKE